MAGRKVKGAVQYFAQRSPTSVQLQSGTYHVNSPPLAKIGLERGVFPIRYFSGRKRSERGGEKKEWLELRGRVSGTLS